MRMNCIFVFIFCLPSVFSFSLGNAFSFALDFVPYVGNLKNFGEAIIGKDAITGEALSWTGRALSLLGTIPFVNYFKNVKLLKNGQKFFRAADRAQKTGKIKNFINFFKAGLRAMKKANKVPNIVKNIFIATKAFFKF